MTVLLNRVVNIGIPSSPYRNLLEKAHKHGAKFKQCSYGPEMVNFQAGMEGKLLRLSANSSQAPVAAAIVNFK